MWRKPHFPAISDTLSACPWVSMSRSAPLSRAVMNHRLGVIPTLRRKINSKERRLYPLRWAISANATSASSPDSTRRSQLEIKW
ncbi:hypothetical protein G6F22_022070 [Rhizopus arrhizus]|nr:hypothetical protein G6F22_022070 [Rhizopus arrhizus]